MPHLFSGTAEQHMSAAASTTEIQKKILEKFFLEQGSTTPNGDQLSKLAASSEMEEIEVQQWFVRKRKREKKKRNQANQKKKKKKKKKAAITATASTSASKSSNDSFVCQPTNRSPLPISDAALREEIKLTTQQLNTDGNNSELYYRRGGAFIALGRDLSNPSSWGSVSDVSSWNQGLEDLERAHKLRYNVQ